MFVVGRVKQKFRKRSIILAIHDFLNILVRLALNMRIIFLFCLFFNYSFVPSKWNCTATESFHRQKQIYRKTMFSAWGNTFCANLLDNRGDLSIISSKPPHVKCLCKYAIRNHS